MAIIIESKGQGTRYGYDESVLHDRLMSLSFQSFSYDPLKRRLLPLDSASTRSDNRIYIRNLDSVTERVAAHPGFRFRNRTL